MPAPKSDWIAKSQQMMYPIEMQAIGMSNQANAQMAANIERTGQAMTEIQTKKQAFEQQYQRTLQIQQAEQNKMSLQQAQLLQESQKIALAEQKHVFEQRTQKTKEHRSLFGSVSRDDDGNIQVLMPGSDEDSFSRRTYKPGPDGRLSDRDYTDLQRTRALFQKAPSSMDRNTEALRAGRLQQQQRDVKESDIKLLEGELDKIKERHDSAKEKFEGFRLDSESWGKINEVFRGEPKTWRKALKANAGNWGLHGRVDAIIEAHEEMTQAQEERDAKYNEWRGRVGDVVGGK